MKLNMEQRRIVELEPSGHMMIKGVAGSGKTTVSVRRISFLHDHYCPEEDDNILLVTYNKTLLSYIKHQYQKLKEAEPELESLFQSTSEIKIVTIDSLMYKYFNQYQQRVKTKYETPTAPVENQLMIKAIHQLKEKYPTNRILSPKNSLFLRDEVTWINACNIPDVETYQNIDRIGRATGGSGTPQKLTKNSELRAAIFELMEIFNALLENNGYITFKKMNLLALQEAQQMNHGKYTHIIIDESQDLTKVQLEFLKCIYSEKRHSSIMFVADNTQSIYSQSWLGKGRPYTTIGYDMSGKSRMLTKNYRTTTEISTAAYGLIEHDVNINNNVDFVKPSLIDRHGHPPMYRFFTSSAMQLDFLISEITTLLNDYRHSDICIVAKEKRLIESVSVGLENAEIFSEILNSTKPDFDSNKVKLVTMHSIKGLEFKVIFLIDLNEGVIPNDSLYDLDDEATLDSEERKLLYVGMTRANDLLYMSSVRKPSKFIKEITNDHLRVKRDCTLRPFHSIGIQDYQLTNQLVDINAKEEVVRQWLLKELVNTYGYPLELIKLEFPVQQFSKRGYVDIGVSIFVNGEMVPYIFAEIKRFGAGIESGFAQLTSYIEADASVRYGVVTDGLEIKCVDRQGEVLNDIPKCRPQFLPETKEKRMYLNLKNGKKYSYATEIGDTENMEISDSASGLFVEYETKTRVPLIGNVAAGVPTTAEEQYESVIVLPNDWIASPNDTFALTVTGDSMIGAGIDKGDQVIVNRQNVASNGDIVIAIIEEEATMKKFMLMGDSVLLISENSSYEPIQMKREDVLINGKVIGVLK
ncbi:transcriptional repressor LexA [Evansella cellulosilytica]|uniref:DNA 3'-5' helicase n=1 Tax=Evansella cellulosilytica (strain ATCC 21833 / DSM 2522 / FERM P-1141 / JCM 9156 / N-4) TaxID=649639 RepID=E6TR42_EVAC2|nr:transcriptional repressor LexA [Evansella cellulosilytica]ADU29418.1 LexA repressor [Evansella cellulosilytica DSM 2522]